MPCELLIHAVGHNKAEKGFIEVVKPGGHEWGGKEGLPNWIQVTCTNADPSEVEEYLASLRNVVVYDLLGSNAEGRRYRLYVHPNIISEFGVGKGIKQEVRDHLVNEYGAVLVNYDSADASATFDIPNTDWQALKNDLLDNFEEVVYRRRYKFDPADVDTVVAAGGTGTFSKSQLISRIIDRLA